MFELSRAMKLLAGRYPQVFQRLLFGVDTSIMFEKRKTMPLITPNILKESTFVKE